MRSRIIRIRYLDSLRGIAALCVVVFHFIGGFGGLPGIPDWFLRTPLAFFTDGIAAVALFFVLSGFVLTFKNFSRPEEYSIRNSLGTFVIHRLFRILPPLMAWILISAFCQRYLFPFAQDIPNQSPWIQSLWAERASLHRILREFIIVAPAAGGHLIPQDWSLTYELNISLFVPLYTYLGIAGNFPFYFYLLLRSSKNVFLFQFFLGMVIAKHFKFIQTKVSELNKTVCFVLFSLGLTLYYARSMIGPWLSFKIPNQAESVIWISNGIGAAIIICVALGSERFQRVLSHDVLLWLGKVSYSLYLLHIVVIKCLAPILMKRLVNFFPAELTYWLSLFIVVGVSLLLSQISYIFFEAPSISLGKTLSDRLKIMTPWVRK